MAGALSQALGHFVTRHLADRQSHSKFLVIFFIIFDMYGPASTDLAVPYHTKMEENKRELLDAARTFSCYISRSKSLSSVLILYMSGKCNNKKM